MDEAQRRSIEHIIHSTRLNEETLTRLADECEESARLMSGTIDSKGTLRSRARSLRERAKELDIWATEWQAWLNNQGN